MIFYDAGKLEWWGRYLEAVPMPLTTGIPWSTLGNSQVSIYDGDAATVQRLRVDAKAIGMGAVNTKRIVEKFGNGQYAAARASLYVKGGFDD